MWSVYKSSLELDAIGERDEAIRDHMSDYWLQINRALVEQPGRGAAGGRDLGRTARRNLTADRRQPTIDRLSIADCRRYGTHWANGACRIPYAPILNFLRACPDPLGRCEPFATPDSGRERSEPSKPKSREAGITNSCRLSGAPLRVVRVARCRPTCYTVAALYGLTWHPQTRTFGPRTMSRNRSRNPCPGNCRAAAPRQYEVNTDRLAAAGLEDEWTSRAMRCGYCGCIYSLDFVQGEPVLTARGYFEGELFEAERWKPVKPPWE